MGKVIIKFKDNHLESFKCSTPLRAKEIAAHRPNVKEYHFYYKDEVIPRPTKKQVEKKQLTQSDLENLMRQEGLI